MDFFLSYIKAERWGQSLGDMSPIKFFIDAFGKPQKNKVLIPKA